MATQPSAGDPRSTIFGMWLLDFKAALATQYRSKFRRHLLRKVLGHVGVVLACASLAIAMLVVLAVSIFAFAVLAPSPLFFVSSLTFSLPLPSNDRPTTTVNFSSLSLFVNLDFLFIKML